MKILPLLGLMALTGCQTVYKPFVRETTYPDGRVVREISADRATGIGVETFTKPFPK
jgi:outer membrane protein assembly factor BamE (lipoprotein component of BamABCDE complex)